MTRARVIRHLLLCGVVVGGTLPFLFGNATPEADLYFIAYSLSRLADTGVLPEHMSYGIDHSPLYYAFYGHLMALLSVDPSNTLPFLNLTDWLFGVGVLAVFGLILNEFGRGADVPIFAVMLLLIPTYWYVSLYAHPVTLSLLFFGGALLFFLKHLSAHNPPAQRLLWFASFCCYVVSLLFRADTAFLCLLFPAALVALRRENFATVVRTASLVTLSAVTYVIALRLLPGATGPSALSFVGHLVATSDPGLWRETLLTVVHSVGVGGLVLLAVSSLVLVRAHRWRSLLLPVVGIVSLLAAWFGIPQHIRRFYPLAMLVILQAYFAYQALERPGDRSRFVTASVAVLLLFNLCIPVAANVALRRTETDAPGSGHPFLRFLSHIITVREATIGAPDTLARILPERELELLDRPVIVLASYGAVGAMSYYLQTARRVRSDAPFPGADEIQTDGNVIELTNGNTMIVVQRVFGDAESPDDLTYFLDHADEYAGAHLVLLERNGPEDLDRLAQFFTLLYVAEAPPF